MLKFTTTHTLSNYIRLPISVYLNQFNKVTEKRAHQLKSFFSHQDNWLRHQLRTLLTNRAPEHLIRALYGHEQPDQEAMHPISSLSINEIKSLSEYLDEVACELNLKQVEVRMHG